MSKSKLSPIFPDVFFRLFYKKLINNDSWNVNCEMMVNKKTLPIISDGILPQFFFGEESHLSVTNAKVRNTASTSLGNLFYKLYKIFNKIKFKYVLFIQYSNFKPERINIDVNFDELEVRIKEEKWWKLLFVKIGERNKENIRRGNIKSGETHRLSVKESSESSTKSSDSSKSNSSEMERQIPTTTGGVKSKHAVITAMKNESSQLDDAAKFTSDSNKTIEEKQLQIQNILTFPGHSFILVLSEEIEEDTKAYNCVLCYQNSFRTHLQGMIQHCKSKEHLLKVMELVNLKDADLSSQKGTSDEIAAVLKGRTSDLDKDGVSFATLSTFLSIQKNIYKRIVSLRKEKAKTPASTPVKIKLSADIGANKKAGMKNPKDTTCGVNSAEKGKTQIGKFVQYPGDPSQGQKQTLKRLHPGSKTLSKTAVNITVAKFESDKFSETKGGKRKIEKIVWDEDKNAASKSDSDKLSETKEGKRKIEKIVWDEDKNTSKSDSDKLSETKNGKRKIEKIVWNENKTTASKSESDTSKKKKKKKKKKIIEIDWDKYKVTDATSVADTSGEMGKRKRKIVEVDWDEDEVTAATSEAEKSSKTKKNKKIVLNEENFKDEDLDDGILDLENLNKPEREVYETYKKELKHLVELNRNRRPNKIIIVTDERDVFTEDEISTDYNLFRIIKIENLSFNNIKKHLVQDPEFGSGVLYVVLCGINSINREKINPACLKAQCTSPCKFLDNTNCEIDLIRKAIFLHKAILRFNKEDTAIFSGLIPSSPNIFNKFSYKKRKCSRIHKADRPQQCIEKYDINKLYLYILFAKLHSKLLGFTPLNLERGFIVKNNNSDNRIVTFSFKNNLKNGYHFTDKFASNRKLAILNKCDKLMEKLSQSTYLEQDKEGLNRLDGGPKSNIRIDYSSHSEEAAVTQITLESKIESQIESFLHEKKKMNYSSIPMTKELQSNYQPVQRVPSEAISASSSKFDKIVVLGNSSYKYYLEQLRSPKVCIMSDDISADDLLSYIKCKEPLMPSRTLWVLVTGIEFLFSNSVNLLCYNLRCSYPLQSTLPSDKVALHSNALTTIHEINNNLKIIEQNVRRVLNFESDFMLFPPIPPAMIIDSPIKHKDLHELFVKYPRCYIVTNIIASYFVDIFQKVSFSFAHFTLSALRNMGISAEPIEKYFDYQLNQIDFISSRTSLPLNRLPFFSEWSNTFREIVSSCVGDSCCFEVSSERESYFKSSRILIYSDDENDETDFESRAALSKYEKKSFSKVKSDCRIRFEGSSKNKKESDIKSVESVVGCKSSIVKAADGVSSRIKETAKKSFVSLTKPLSKDTFEKSVKDPKPELSCKSSIVKAADGVSSRIKETVKKSFVSPTKPLSKDTFKKSVKDPKPELSIKKVKQPIVKQKCSIYEIATDDRPLPFLDSVESDAKPENLTVLYEPDPKSEQDMESEIFDNFEEFSEENLYSEISNESADISNIGSSEEFSEENLYSEISNDSADISNVDSSEDAKKLSSKSVKEHLNINPSNDSAFHITAQIASRSLKKKNQNINTVGDIKSKEKVGKSSSNEQLNLIETTKQFSGKVLTNIPDNKETYNDEVKRQNLFEDRCQMNEEKVNKTKETVKNLIIKDTNNKMQNVDTEDYTTTQPLKINGKETNAKNKLENPDIIEPQSTLIETVEDCAISEHLGPNCEENTKNKQNMDTTVHLPMLIKTIENVTTQPLKLNDKESLGIDYDGTSTDANSKDMKWESTVNENLKEKEKNENMNVTSSFVEVIQSDINHLNNSVVLGKNSEFSSNILPLEEETSEEDMYKSSKIEENSDSSCDDNKSDLGEDMQEQLLIEEELEAEIFGDDECSYDDDDDGGYDDEDKARDTLEDDIENSSKRLYSPAPAEPDRENIPTSKHAYSSLSKEEKLHSDNSVIQIESFLNNVKEVALEIKNVSKDKEDLESCESTSVLENDTKISVSESKSDNITKETLNITVGHISECNFSSGSIPEDTDFASNDSSQALTHVTINNDLKIDESFRKSEDSEDKHEVKMDSFDYDFLNKESDIIFDLEKCSDSQSSNERFGNFEEKNVCNNEQDIENIKSLQDSISNIIESSAGVDIKSQSQKVSEIAFENLDTSNQVPKFNICTEIFDETVIKRGELENFDSKIEVVQDSCDERKANQIEDVAVDEKTFENEETSEDKPDISEGSKKITEESDEESKLKFVSGEETTEKSNKIKLKLGKSVDNSDQTVDSEMSEASRDSTEKEMSKLTIDHIEILNDPKIIKSISDDQKNNEVNFIRLVDGDEKLTVKESFKLDNDKFVDHVNHNDSVVKDRVNKVIELAEKEDDPDVDDDVEMNENSLKKIAFENIVDDGVDNLEENVETNLNKTDMIKDAPSITTFENEKSVLKEKLENKADHPIGGYCDSPLKDNLTGSPYNKDFKNTDSPANCSEKEIVQYSNKTNVQNDVPMKKKNLVEYDDDVFEIGDKEKEGTVNHAVSKTNAVYDIENSDTNESIVIKASSEKLNNYSDYSNMNFEAKSDNTVVNNSSEELNKSACDLKKNATTEFINPSTTSINSLELNETTKITKDLENPSCSYESAPNKDPFSDLQNSELEDSDSYNQTVTSVDKNISHSANSNTNKFSTNSNLVKNSNKNIVKEILIESDSHKKDVFNESVCSTYDPFNPTSNVESVGTDIETESNKTVGVAHRTTLNPSVGHSSKIEIETHCDQKSNKFHKRTTKSTVEDLSKTEIKTDSNLTVDKLKKMTAKSIEDHSFKSEIQPRGEKKEGSYKFKILKKSEMNKLVSYIFISDSEEEVEEEDSSNIHSGKGTKIEKVIARYDHIYIIGGFNPLSEKNQKLLNFTFINKSISDLNEDNVIDLLEEKGCIVANSLCIFICDIIDIMKKRVETKSITSKSQGHNFIVYELKDSSSDTTEEGKLFITKSITSFIGIVDRLRNKLPVVVMPLQPYMLTVQFKFATKESGADDSRLFIQGSSYKWTHYRDHFVNDWMRILNKNSKNVNKTYIDPFVTKPPFVYPISKAELKGTSIKNRKLEWTTNVNEVILKLVKAEFKMKSKKSVDSIKKKEHTTAAGCSKDKFCEGEKCKIKITNLSESIPNKFFEEMSKNVGKEAICKFEEGYVGITFDSHLKGHLFANYLNNLAIGDTILKTSFLRKDCKKGILKLDETRRKNFRESLQPLFELWEVSVSEIVMKNIKNIRNTLSCESYKTIECEKSECDEASCIFYHSEMDRRRNPYSVPYRSAICKIISTCTFGDKCNFSHNDYEYMFHPSEINFKLCQDNKTRKQCFSVKPLCARAHRDSPETFFTKFWHDTLLFGTPLAVEFLAGAISKINPFNSACKNTRIFMMGASMPFLHNVRKAVNQICTIHSVKHDFVGEIDLVFECEPLLFGTPSNFLKRIDNLVLHRFTLIIVSQVDVLLSIKEERKALINFFARCQMPFSPPYVQTLFVADEYDADMKAKIEYYFSKNVRAITKPEHKVKFDHEVPCAPFELKALPEWLNTGPDSLQVFPFLSAEVAEFVVEGNKKKLANTPFYSSDSSELSDSLDTKDDKRSIRRGKKRKTSSTQHRSISPSHKRSCSRSPRRRRSISPSHKRSCSRSPRRRRSISPSHKRYRSRSPRRRRSISPSHKRYSSRSPTRRRSTSRSSKKPLKRKDRVRDSKDRELKQSPRRKPVVEEIQERSSRSPPKKRTNVSDEKVQTIKPSQSPPQPLPTPPPPKVPPGSKFEGKDKKEQTKPDLSMDRIIHRSILLESAIQMFNTTSLREELGNVLYEEFEAAREKLCFKLEEEFDVYKTMPRLYDKYEECYEGFMQVYKIKFPKQSEEHKEEMWKLFWVSKFDFVEKSELRNRMVDLIGRFKQKVQSLPPPPPPPIISGMDSHFKSCKSEIKMSSASDVSTAAYTLPSSNASSTNRISDVYSNPTPVLSSNAPMSTNQVSDYSNFSHVHPPPPKISDHSSQCTYSNETSGVQARFHPSSSLSKFTRSNFTRVDLNSKSSEENLHNKFSSSNTPSLPESISSGHMLSIDNHSKRNSPSISSVITPTHTKASEDESSLQDFSIYKAMADLELIVPDIEALGSSIKYIINIAKENGINSEKSLRTFIDDDNITLMKLALMKIKGMEGKKELYSSLERSVNGLIKYAKEELVKKERKVFALNLEGIAKATVGKDSSAILQMIRTAARYEGVELTKQQENESYMKVCSIHFNLATN